MLQGLQSLARGKSPSRKDSDAECSQTNLPKEPDHSGVYLLENDVTPGNEAGAATYEVDIVAVHGLNGSAIGTWTGKKEDQKSHQVTKTLWLKDFLYKDLPGSRVFTYKYDSHLFFSKSKATTDDYAQKLLLGLKGYRDGQERRPIIFIAHSLGGIVCEKAMTLANEDSEFSTLLDSTVGIIFFGTPHHGASGFPDLALNLGSVVDTVSRLTGPRWFGGKLRKDLVTGVKPDSSELSNITKRFGLLLRKKKLRTISIFETEEQPPLGRLVVEASSAIMGGPQDLSFSRSSNHTGLCRFGDPSEPDYKIIFTQILTMCKESLHGPSLDASEIACVDLFRRFDLHEYRSNLSSERVGDTCSWILENPQYQRWAVQDTRANLLWISGHPGWGKTILSSYIIDDLEEKAKSIRDDPITCYFFCIATKRDYATEILGSIIFQILVKRGQLVKHVMPAKERDRDVFESFDSLWKIFTAIISDDHLSSVNIVIDALDECNEASRNTLMKSIAKLIDRLRSSTSRSVKFLITSRPEFLITSYFEADDAYEPLCLPLEDAQAEIDKDLSKVIHQGTRKIARDTNAKQSAIDNLEEFLITNAGQSFLWAKLNIEILDGELSNAVGDFRNVLAGVPRTQAAIYKRLLERIPSTWAGFARNLLQIVVASRRPLNLKEINLLISAQGMSEEARHAVTSTDEQQLYPNIERDITKVLGSLVRIFDSKVYLVHATLKTFLIEGLLRSSLAGDPDTQGSEGKAFELRRANLALASACMAYLSLGCFRVDIYSKEALCDERASIASSRECSSGSEEDILASSNQDEESVDGYIYGHTQEVLEEVDQEIRARAVKRYPALSYAAYYWAEHFAESQELADQAVVALFGHYTLLEKLLDSADIINTESLAAALFFASRSGHDRCVVRLLQTNVAPDSYEDAFQSPLCFAADHGHLNIVRALVSDSRVNVNYRGKFGGTSLSFAAGCGYVEIVKCLLSREDIDVNIKDSLMDSPLSWAIVFQQVEVVEVLVADRRVDLNIDHETKTSPIAQAIEEKNEKIVTLLLLHRRFDADLPSVEGRTPFADAAMKGDIARIQLLHRHKKLNNCHSHSDQDGRSAMSLAAERGHDNVVNILLKYKVPGVDEADRIKQWTPLLWAVGAQRNSTMEILLRTPEVNVNHKDSSGRTALSWAVSHRNEVAVRLLLAAARIIPLAKDDEGLTPLDRARTLDDPLIANLLKEALM